MTIINQTPLPLVPRQAAPLKWAGGKFNALPQILPHFPNMADKTFVDVFAGSATVSLNVKAKAYWLNDFNKDLTYVYKELQQHIATVNSLGPKLFVGRNTEKAYYEIRDRFNATKVARWRAYLFMYLNRHAFNGICRYNSKGQFNVPFGRYSGPKFPIAETTFFSQHLANATITNLSFEQLLPKVQPNSVVYCDPPYIPLSATANFSDYTGEGFSLEQQKELAQLALALKQRGIPVYISNHDTQLTRQLYSTCDQYITFPVSRTISSKTTNRAPVMEVLAIWKP